jgi:hypothetical protein
MKTLILAAAIVSTLAFVATHSHANARPIITSPVTAQVDATVWTWSEQTPLAQPAMIYVPEQTIVVEASHVTHATPKAAHVETYDEHVKRLMTATPEMVSCAACTPRKPFESVSGHVSHLGDR